MLEGMVKVCLTASYVVSATVTVETQGRTFEKHVSYVTQCKQAPKPMRSIFWHKSPVKLLRKWRKP